MTGTTAAVIAAIGLILTILNIIDKIVALTKAAQAPNEARDEKIAELTKKVEDLENEIQAKTKEYDENIDNNLENINQVRETMLSSTEVIMRSLQALTAHALDNNHIEQLRKSQEELNEYLLTGQLRGRRFEKD